MHPVLMDTSVQQVRWAGTATMEARALLATWDAAGGLAQEANQGLQGNRGPQGSKEREDLLDWQGALVRWATAVMLACTVRAVIAASGAERWSDRLVHKVRVDPWDMQEPSEFLGR